MAPPSTPDVPDPAEDRVSLDLESRLEELAGDYLEALRDGLSPGREQLLAAHPDIAGPLERRLRLTERLHEAALSAGGSGATIAARSLACPHCGCHVELAGSSLGTSRCSSCGGVFRVEPEPDAAWVDGFQGRVGRFQITGVLGSGSFGVVYQAHDTELGRVVTLKVPRTGLFHSREEEERFLREARSAALLRHPGIVEVHEIAAERGVPYIVREFIDGRTLAEVIHEGRPAVAASAEIVARSADALQCAHEHGIVHRDVKPDNILMDAAGQPHLTDFGLARRDEDEVTVTVEGQVLGTPSYMAPEQATGDHARVGPHSDIYGLGVILYELLTGVRPFAGLRSMVIHQVIHDEPRPPRRLNHHVPRDLETICLKAMAKEPARRYASAAALAADLRSWLRGEPIQARPISDAERLWRWCRRNPLVAGLSAAVAAVVLAGLVSVIVVQEVSRRKIAGERDVKEQALVAERQALTAREQALDRAEGLRLAAQARAALRTEPGLAFAVAVEGVRRAPGVLATSALLDTLLVDREELVLPSGGVVSDACFAPDGSWVAATCRDFSVRVWDASSGEEVLCLFGHQGGPNAIAVAPDGRFLASSAWDATVRVWERATGRQLLVLTHRNVVEHAAFDHSGTRLLSVSWDGTAIIWELPGGRRAQALTGHEGWVVHGAFSPDGNVVVTTSHDGTARLWEAATGRLLHILAGHGDRVLHAAFSPGGGEVVTASADGTARVWSVQRGTLLARPLDGHRGEVLMAAFSPDGERVATASADGTARLWRLASPAVPSGGPREENNESVVLIGHEDQVSAISFSPDGGRLLTASRDRTARLWDAGSGQQLVCLRGHSSWVVRARFSPDGARAVTASDDFTVRVWDVAVRVDLAARVRSRADRFLAMSPDGTRAIAHGKGRIAALLDAASGETLCHLRGHEEGILAACFSPDGRRAATASLDHTARLWDLAAGDEPAGRVLRGHRNAVDHVAFSRDGTRVATASRDLSVMVWEAETGDFVALLPGHREWVDRVLFSPNGAQLAAMTSGTARLWDLRPAKPKPLHDLHGGMKIYFEEFSPDGSLLVTASTLNRLALWDVASGRSLVVLGGAGADVASASFDVPGSRLATVHRDGSVRVWDLAAGVLLALITPADSPLVAASLETGGKLLTTAASGLLVSLPLDSLAAASTRRPRSLSMGERNQLEMGTPAEREEHRRRLAAERLQQAVALAWRQVEADRANLEAWRWHAPVVHNHLLALASRQPSGGLLARDASPGSPPVAAVVSAIRFLEEDASFPDAPPEARTRVTQAWASLAPWLPTCAAADAALAGLDRVDVAPQGDEWRLFRGRKEPATGFAWTAVACDDSGWERARPSFTVRKGAGRTWTILEDMPLAYTTIYLRRRFALEEVAAWTKLVLELRVEGGFIAFLNGIEVARGRAGAPGEVRRHDRVAEEGAEIGVEVDLPLELLRAGDNVLAIQALAGPASSPDFRLSPSLVAAGAPQAGRDQRLLTEAREQAVLLGGTKALRYLEGRLFQRSGAAAEAAAVFRELARDTGGETLPHSRLVESLRALGREAEARAALVDLLLAIPPMLLDEKLLTVCAWRVLRLPGRGLDEYARAAIWIGQASELAPMNVVNFSRLAAAQYRLGLYEEAVATLNLTHLLSREASTTDVLTRTVSTFNTAGFFDFALKAPRERWRDVAFLAMACYRVGRLGEARDALNRLRELVRDLPDDASFAPFVLEAERLVGPLLDSPAGR